MLLIIFILRKQGSLTCLQHISRSMVYKHAYATAVDSLVPKLQTCPLTI